MIFRRPEGGRRFPDSGRLRLEEGAEGLGEGRPAPVAMRGDVERAGDLEVAYLEAPHEAAPAVFIDGAPRDHGHTDSSLDRLLDGLGRAHFPDDPEGREVAAGLGQCGLEGRTRSR